MIRMVDIGMMNDDVKMYNFESFDSLCELACGLRRGSGGWG